MRTGNFGLTPAPVASDGLGNADVAIACERRLIAAELHDTVFQPLVQMKLQLALLEHEMRGTPSLRAIQCASDLGDALDAASSSLRQLMAHFRAQMDPRGLMPTLYTLAESHQTLTGIDFRVEERAHDWALDRDQELQVFLILQEALTNIVRHAHAKSAQLLVERDGLRVCFTVDDDGSGFDPSKVSTGHYGLAIMRERAAQIGASLVVCLREGIGTRLTLTVPLPGGLP